MDFDYDVVVIGAGAVGLAVARQLAPRCSSLVVVERHERFGEEASSRNSEVIHAGIYYEPGSLRGRLCVRGKHLLYELVEKADIPFLRLGKIIVATTEEEEADLERLRHRASDNGVEDCRLLTAAEVRELEPAVQVRAGLLSPSTGILDAHSLMRHCASTARATGADLAFETRLFRAEKSAEGFRLTVLDSDGDELTLTTKAVVNAAGLDADTVAGLFGVDCDEARYRQRYVKGNYFRYAGPSLGLSRLIYPVPSHPKISLGIHSVQDLGGQVRFGPDAHYLPTRVQNYDVPATLRPAFGEAIRHYLPSVRDDDLHQDFSGIRAKLSEPEEPPRDFVVCHETGRGLAGLVNCIGIDSPGLTAALAIAEHVEELLEEYLRAS